MLAALAIRDIVLIERLDLAFAPGLTVLTGETGAGKSILMDALALALGGRGDGGLVRQGAEQGQVSASFDVPGGHPVHALLAENGIGGEGEVILRRVQGRDGRSRAFVNDQPAGVALLRRVGQALVEMHGQHDDRALVDPAAHRDLLDAFGGLAGEAAEVGRAFAAWRAAEAALAAHRQKVEAARADADYLRAAAEELRVLTPRPGEEAELATARQAMQRAEKVAGDVAEADEIVSGAASPAPALAGLARRLERRVEASGGLFAPVVAALDRALTALDEAGAALDHVGRAIAFDPRDLERTEERLFALRAAGRKFGVPVDALAERAARMETELAALDAGEADLAGLARAATKARADYDARAGALSARRHAAAGELERAVMGELPALKLDRAVFSVDLTTDAAAPAESGIDRPEFWVRTNPGSRPGPLARIASGGELSRFLLALKVALADRGSAPTLVFDEIDTAVGGAVSDAIGQRLARLAAGVQVLAITHAPQVAALAARHLLISKEGHASEDRVVTRVAPLAGDRRREEIARMLAGSVITPEARAAADRLIAGVA